MSIGLVTVAYGPTYQAFLPDWADAVARLERAPDQIIIVGDDIDVDLLFVLSNKIGEFDYIISPIIPQHHPQVLVNEAIEALGTTWVCKMDVDDLILPHALNPIDTTSEDVFMFNIRIGDNDLTHHGITADMILRRTHNYVFSGSPFRRWLWERNHFRDMIFEDWAFWIGCATQGARFKHSETIDYIYTQHPNQISSTADTAYWEKVVRDVT